jgi:hypothetical protein
MAVTFLLPLVVAVGAFYLTPAGKGRSSASVEGTLYGLKIKAGYAFAAYVIVLLFAIPFTNKRLEKKEQENDALRTANNQLRVQKETWRIKGQVVLAGSAPQAYKVEVIPPRPHLDSRGKFEFDLRIPPRTDYAGPQYIPEIVISRDGYEPVSFRLDPDARYTAGYGEIRDAVTFDEPGREIRIESPIRLVAAPREPYNPPPTLPSPVPTPSPSPIPPN